MVSQIESADNKNIKQAKKLYIKKNRDKSGQYVIEGFNLVCEAIRRGIDIDFILFEQGVDLPDSISKAIDDGVRAYAVASRVFENITDAEQGVKIIAVASKPQYDTEQISEILSDIAKENNILVLDRLQDPGNVGTIIRTAEATGYSMIIGVKGTADIYSPKVLRATAGAIYAQPFVYVENADELRQILSKIDKTLVVTSVDDGIPYYDADLSHSIALVIGNEGNGVSDEIFDIADTRVNIPMQGNIESLNAAISASILMYETIRKNK